MGTKLRIAGTSTGGKRFYSVKVLGGGKGSSFPEDWEKQEEWPKRKHLI